MTKVINQHELTNYEWWQLNNYGNIIPDCNNTPEDELFESGIEELNRLAEYQSALAQTQEEEQCS